MWRVKLWYAQALMHIFFSKKKDILLSSFTFILNMLQHVICHPSKEAIHTKTTYKLSTATSVTSFIDTFFCSIIWTISPVGKHMTFYFQHKAPHTLCLFQRSTSQHLCVLCVTFSSSPYLQWLRSLTLPAQKRGLQLAQTLLKSSAFLLGQVWK